ncbi:hypothetical protein KP509_27G024600 [Ceratopteris richardii]|uniref:Protein GPR107 n=4 Tax=Ceratopteris richardii TaxID=49495 RepID=A0A8T2RGH0_CERRI|nr:hypothetical protein KP509_27G024600 [Ceratopteris richardii]
MACYKMLLSFMIFLSCVLNVEAEISELSVEQDSRDLIVMEEFGYTQSGYLEIEVKDAKWSVPSGATIDLDRLKFMGFFLASEEDRIKVNMELEQKIVDCVLQSSSVQTIFTFTDLKNGYHNQNYSVRGANLYTLMFANCLKDVSVSMSVRTSMYNLEGNAKDYLSDVQSKLPALYFSFFCIYIILAAIWTYTCVKQRATAHRIHILMGILVVLKALYMFSDAEDKYYIRKTGTPHGWDVAFYFFSFLKGVMLFTVIVLIGTGWSFLKPYLQGKEKKVLMIVIPLQVLENIATVVLGETGLSDQYWLTWNQLLILVDVICCCAVLFPIVWSIKHLREAARTDGKAARNLVKLMLFRKYYVVVVTYIYLTRIVVFALQTATSYHYRWVSEMAKELVTLAFYVFTGYSFRPVPHNPYFVLDEDEEEAAMEALKDDDFEL